MEIGVKAICTVFATVLKALSQFLHCRLGKVLINGDGVNDTFYRVCCIPNLIFLSHAAIVGLHSRIYQLAATT